MASATERPAAVDYGGSFDEITREMATAAFRQDPYALYARMRQQHPAYRSAQGLWYLTRYADVEAALHNPRLSSDGQRFQRWQARQTGPPSDRGRIREWSRHIVDRPEFIPDPESLARIEQTAEEFLDYLGNLVRERRAEPADDLVSALVAVQERGDQLTDDELLSTCFLLLAAGHETTINLIGNGMLALLRHPDQLRRLQDDPALIRPAIEELLRYDSPVQMTSRIVAGGTEIAGQALGDGEFVFAVLGAANRDPDRFSDPDRLDLGRADNQYLSFGNGPHFCLGAPLARLEGEVAIGALVRRFPALRLDTDTVEWRPNPALRGLESLPVAY